MSFAYSVAIKLSVANLASQGVRILANDLLKAHGAATNLQGKLSALKMVAVGYGLDRAGQGILGFMGKSIDASKEYTRQLSLMSAAGMGQKDIAEATAQAWKTSQSVITSSAAENLKAIRELRSVFGLHHMGEAYAILPTVQRTKAVLEALTGKEQEGVAFDMVKAIELRTPGVMSAQRMQQNADLMARALMGMGGTLTVNDFHMALKQAKTSAFGLNDDFVYSYLPTLIQEVKTKGGGAQTAGTALMSTYGAVIQGTLKKSAIPLWEQMGLINPSDVVKNSTGQMQLKPGAVKGAQLFQQNPYAWANQVLAPAIDAYGKSRGLNREQILSGMLGNRNAQWFLNTMIGKSPQFERDRELIASGGSSKQAYDRLLKSNPQLAEQALHNQWQNILAILGYQVLPKLIPFMVKFANGLDHIAQWMSDHPNLTAAIAFGLIGIGGALMLIGKALMLAGVIKFLGLAPMIAGWFTSAGSAIGLFFGIFRGIMGAVWGGILTGGRALLGDLLLVFTPVGLVIAGIAVAALLVWNNWKEIKGALIKSWADIKDGVVKLFHGDIIGALGSFTAVFLRGWQTVFNTLIAGVNSILPAALQISKTHFADDYDAWRNRSAAVPNPGGTMQHRPAAVYLDGRKVGQMLTARQAQAANRPNTGATSFDWSRAAPSTALRRP
ncbi:MAG TPA: hypothetical protein EYH41_04300 [Novosphingobium capsulatum]|nr:hypothetical protein [Novosphingobium capsulatum]